MINFDTQNKLLNEYFDKQLVNESPEELKKTIIQIEDELTILDDLLKAKEQEWNNMLHIKKMKEEILERLNRKRRIHDIRNILISPENYSKKSSSSASSSVNNEQINLCNSTSSISTGAATTTTGCGGGPGTTQSILQNRANMKSSDLVKEKLTTARLHRWVELKLCLCFVFLVLFVF